MYKSFSYKAKSLIYAKGDEEDKIYIVKSGKINLVYKDIESHKDIRDQLLPGEFFGVKSALGRYPREENAIAVTDAAVLALSVEEFEELALSNVDLMTKMLRVFSKQMRRIHHQVSRLLKSHDEKPDEGLYAIGEKYLKKKRFTQAKYIFDRYLEHYPTGSKAALAAKNRQLVEISLELSVPDKKKKEKKDES